VKRALLVASVVVAAAGIVAGILWLRRSGDEPAHDSRFASAVVELGLALQAPTGSADPDSAIFISLGLASPRVINLMALGEQKALNGLAGLSIGTVASPWWLDIELIARIGEVEKVVPWTPLPRDAEPIADLSSGFGTSVRGVVRPGDLGLSGPVQLQARMQWKAETIGSNVVDIEVRKGGVDATTNATLLANYHLEMGNLDEALSWAEELVSLQPRQPNTYALRARILEELGDLAEARISWLRAIQLLPEDLGEAPTIYVENLRAVEARLAGVDASGRRR
jgi:tetratricopeptide (TPR) repeat protein